MWQGIRDLKYIDPKWEEYIQSIIMFVADGTYLL